MYDIMLLIGYSGLGLTLIGIVMQCRQLSPITVGLFCKFWIGCKAGYQ